MPISNRSDCLRWSRTNGVTSRTAVYGPVRTVVWQGSAGDRCPYADQIALALIKLREGLQIPGLRSNDGQTAPYPVVGRSGV
jgi:hypothetical protein